MINRLFDAGYVRREIIETDKRKVVISLTDSGLNKLMETRRIKEEWLAGAMSEVYSNEELALIKAFLPLLKRITDYNG
ncbi:Transcriptional regulator, MarR family [Arcticibacter svalbardensis MN12-7]|uniref:Transcriptional regulator, MarR family n=1 Tax=Arcticibacter svalbardensis MN12-7 TaxID=1150600 RepID=R9GQQ8_9SPHI|nr:Transcriptional regulator, MarR family [Arcticibacter svalbardensis MN12-7]